MLRRVEFTARRRGGVSQTWRSEDGRERVEVQAGDRRARGPAGAPTATSRSRTTPGRSTPRLDDGGHVVCAFRADKHAHERRRLHARRLPDDLRRLLDLRDRARRADGDGSVTASLNCEFVDAAREGELIECRGEVVRAGASMVFVRGSITHRRAAAAQLLVHHQEAPPRAERRDAMATLSALDLSPVSADGGAQAQGVRDTIEVAKAAERLGYNRFWVAEHHSIQHLSSPAPEILIAALTQVTTPHPPGLGRGDAAQLLAAEGGRGVHGARGAGAGAHRPRPRPRAGRRPRHRPGARLALVRGLPAVLRPALGLAARRLGRRAVPAGPPSSSE